MLLEASPVTKLKARILEWGYARDLPLPMVAFAQCVGINKGRVSEYWNGKRIMPANHLLVMADELRCSPHELVGWME